MATGAADTVLRKADGAVDSKATLPSEASNVSLNTPG